MRPNRSLRLNHSLQRHISAMLNTLKTLGKSATIAELVGATTGLETLGVVATLSACYYTGAVIGSIAVASGRYISCGTRLADVFAIAQKSGGHAPWLHQHLGLHQEIINPKHPARSSYGFRARIAAA